MLLWYQAREAIHASHELPKVQQEYHRLLLRTLVSQRVRNVLVEGRATEAKTQRLQQLHTAVAEHRANVRDPVFLMVVANGALLAQLSGRLTWCPRSITWAP